MNTNAENENNKEESKAFKWVSYFSWDFELATEMANKESKQHKTYITAIKVTPKLATGSQVVGEWMLTSKYDPRLAAK